MFMKMNKIIIFSVISAFALLKGSYAQGDGLYHVIVVNGRIVDQGAGNTELRNNMPVRLQTNLLFDNPSHNAVLRSSFDKRYRLVAPGRLHEIRSRPSNTASLRSSSGRALSITPELLENYFGADTFAIVGSSLKLNVDGSVAENMNLVFRFQENNTTQEVVSADFVINKNNFGEHSQINDCLIMLREGDTTTPITTVTLLFVEEQNLHQEFAAWLNGLGRPLEMDFEIHDELKQYCRDVYGVIDNEILNRVINNFLRNRK